jgi:hypothetical protein
MQRAFSDLRPGDSIYASDGRPVGTMSYAQGDGTIWLDIDGRTIRLDARNASKPVVRLGSALVFSEKNRQPQGSRN